MKTNLIKIKDYRNTSLNDYDFTIGERKTDFLKNLGSSILELETYIVI